jgi:HsdM N-terminal domain
MARIISNGSKDSSATIGFEAKLWLAADKLRNNMDAAEYKHVVLGLIFFKYISDTFEEHRAKLAEGKGDYAGANPEDQDEYSKDCVNLVEKHHGKKIGSPIRNWILELDQMDPKGTAFRYADAEPKAMMYEEHWLDFVHFKFAMGRVFDLLDSAVLRLETTGKAAKRFK